jgi:CRP/FNR family cyclic AMP-dependent transcriptional regulator
MVWWTSHSTGAGLEYVAGCKTVGETSPLKGREETLDVSQLKRIPLFSDASDEELRRVAIFAESKEIPKGEVVIEEGGFSRELLAIEDGKAEVTRDGEKIADLGPGDIFGEAGMLDDEMRSATVTAKSRLKLISLRHFEVKRLKKDAPDVYRRIEQLVEERSD